MKNIAPHLLNAAQDEAEKVTTLLRNEGIFVTSKVEIKSLRGCVGFRLGVEPGLKEKASLALIEACVMRPYEIFEKKMSNWQFIKEMWRTLQ